MLIYLQMIETAEDKTKFEILYTEYREWMGAIAFSILNNKQDAEDAVHNAFVKVAENIKKVGDPYSPKTKAYIVTIISTAIFRTILIISPLKRRPKQFCLPSDRHLWTLYTFMNWPDISSNKLTRIVCCWRSLLTKTTILINTMK